VNSPDWNGLTRLTVSGSSPLSVQPIKPVERIHVELNAGPSRHPISARELLQTLRKLSKVSDVP